MTKENEKVPKQITIDFETMCIAYFDNQGLEFEDDGRRGTEVLKKTAWLRYCQLVRALQKQNTRPEPNHSEQVEKALEYMQNKICFMGGYRMDDYVYTREEMLVIFSKLESILSGQKEGER